MAISFSTILKWIGYGTTILSFVAGVRVVTSSISSRMADTESGSERLASAR
jgi:hypothetical protein